MIIAVDFDGTIVTNRYPSIGKEIDFATDYLKMIQRELGHQLILWTVREGTLLDEAVEFCRSRGLEFYSVNTNFTGEERHSKAAPRKLMADMFIDDRNWGGIPDWRTIYEVIKQGRDVCFGYTAMVSCDDIFKNQALQNKRRGLFGRK